MRKAAIGIAASLRHEQLGIADQLAVRSLKTVQKGLRRIHGTLLHRFYVQLPPLALQQPFDQLRRMPKTDDPGGDARDDGVRRHVLGDHRLRSDDRPCANRHAFENQGATADPYVMTNDRGAALADITKRGVGVLKRVAADPVGGMGIATLAYQHIRAD